MRTNEPHHICWEEDGLAMKNQRQRLFDLPWTDQSRLDIDTAPQRIFRCCISTLFGSASLSFHSAEIAAVKTHFTQYEAHSSRVMHPSCVISAAFSDLTLWPTRCPKFWPHPHHDGSLGIHAYFMRVAHLDQFFMLLEPSFEMSSVYWSSSLPHCPWPQAEHMERSFKISPKRLWTFLSCKVFKRHENLHTWTNSVGFETSSVWSIWGIISYSIWVGRCFHQPISEHFSCCATWVSLSSTYQSISRFSSRLRNHPRSPIILKSRWSSLIGRNNVRALILM